MYKSNTWCKYGYLIISLVFLYCNSVDTTKNIDYNIVNGHILSKDTYETSRKVVFKVDTVKVESTLIAGKKFDNYENATSQYTRNFIVNDYDKVVTERVTQRPNYTIENTAYKDIKLIQCNFHPFINALHVAYQMHLPFVISPDMIWLMIAQGFATHVGKNAEELRVKFTDFKGEKELRIKVQNNVIGNPLFDWENLFKQFSDSIEANTGHDLLDLITGNFSTTTPIEKAAFQITLMDAMSDYFNYTFYSLCGIPEITLEGTEEDWRRIEIKAEALAQYGLEDWIASLRPVLREFTIVAGGGEIDTLFWRGIYQNLNHSSGRDVTHLTGWITKFFPYNNHGNRTFGADSISFSELPSGLSTVATKYDDNGRIYPMEFDAGFVGYRQDEKTYALRPEISWAVVHTGDPQ
jgi:hypothetical protein